MKKENFFSLLLVMMTVLSLLSRMTLTACAATELDITGSSTIILGSGGTNGDVTITGAYNGDSAGIEVQSDYQGAITLSGVDITSSQSAAIYIAPGAVVTLALIGDNTITSGKIHGIQSDTDLTINGGGSLTVTSGPTTNLAVYNAISVSNNSLTIENATVTATGGANNSPSGRPGCNGIGFPENGSGALIVNNATVTANGGYSSSGNGGRGIVNAANINVTGGGTVTANAGSSGWGTSCSGVGIVSFGSVNINLDSSSSLIAKSGNQAMYCENATVSDQGNILSYGRNDGTYNTTRGRYSVAFDSMEGSTVDTITEIFSGSKIVNTATPTKTDYIFGGWYKENTHKTKWNLDTDTVTTNTDLFAKWIDPSAAYIVTIAPATLTEAAANDGSLDPNTVVITIASGTLAADVADADVTAANLPAGLDYTVTRDSDTQLTITITGNATNHADANDVNNLTFTITQAKVTGAEGNLTTDNISIDFNDPPPQAATPTADPPAGAVAPGTQVELSCATEGASIYYTTDGNDPTTGSDLYSAPVTIDTGATIKAFAVKAGMSDSDILTAAYTILDSIAPTVTSVTVPAGGTYGAGQDLDFTVNFSEDVTVNTGGGTPYIPIILDTGGTVNASYVSGSGSSALLFRYTTEPGDSDNNGIAVGTAIITNGGTLQDSAGNDATLTLNSVGSTAGVLVETTVPTVTSVTVPANGTYVAGQSLDFTVNFSEAVTVNTAGGTPYLRLTVGSASKNAGCLSGSGSNSIVFRYTIEPGDTGTLTVGTLEASGGALKDAAGNDANLTLNNVGDTSNILVGKNMALTAPNGGESWAAGSYQTIRWNYTGNPGQVVKIELLRSNVLNQVVSYGANTGSDGSGSHQWQVPANQATGSDYKIRVTSILDNTYTVTSEGAFTITVPQAPAINLISPGGGESWAARSSQAISWNYNGSPGDRVKVELLKNGAVAKVINAGTYIGLSGSGSCQWTVPSNQAAGDDYKIRVTSLLNNTYTDTSDGAFTITGPQAPAITVSSPGGGETWEAGSSRTIIWNYSGNIGQTVKVELLKDDALDQVITYSTFIGSSGSGSCQWTVPPGLAAGSGYKIRVTCNAYTDTSDGAFTVTGPQAPAITVSSPGNGETWAAGSSQTIRWNYTGNPGYLVKIELLKNDAVSRVITYGALIGSNCSGTYQWTIPQGLAAGNDYKIRVTSVSNNACADTGDGTFSITGP